MVVGGLWLVNGAWWMVISEWWLVDLKTGINDLLFTNVIKISLIII